MGSKSRTCPIVLRRACPKRRCNEASHWPSPRRDRPARPATPRCQQLIDSNCAAALVLRRGRSGRPLHPQATPALRRNVAVDQLATTRRDEIRAIVTILAVLRRRLIVNCRLRDLRFRVGLSSSHQKRRCASAHNENNAATDSGSFGELSHFRAPWWGSRTSAPAPGKNFSLATIASTRINANTRSHARIQIKIKEDGTIERKFE